MGPRRVELFRRLATAVVSLAAGAFSVGAFAAPPVKGRCEKLSSVSVWTGSFSATGAGRHRVEADGGAAVWKSRFDAGGSLRLIEAYDEGQRQANAWRGEPLEFTASGEGRFGPEGADMYSLERIGSLAENENGAGLSLDCERGTYSVSFWVGKFEAKRTTHAPQVEGDACKGSGADPTGMSAYICAQVRSVGKRDFSTNFRAADVPLPAEGAIEGQREVEVTIFDTPTRLSLRWSLIPGQPSPAELVIEPASSEAYEAWVPAPKPEAGVSFGDPAPLLVRAALKPKKPGAGAPPCQLEFTLKEVSEHPGRCSNFPHGLATKADLRFVQEGSGADVVVEGDKKARTKGKVTEALVAVEALDAGAYGKVEVRCAEQSLTGEYKPLRASFLSVPRDDDRNHVADGWQRQKGLEMDLPEDWDEDEWPPGQLTQGDGMGLYGEYRGYVVLKGGRRTFLRMNPKAKEVFYVDEGKILDPATWKQITLIEAYELDASLVNGAGGKQAWRQVDFAAGAGGDHHKYAVRIETVRGMYDGDPPPSAPTLTDPAYMHVYGYSYGYVTGKESTPKDADYVRVFPDRIRKDLLDQKKLLESVDTDPKAGELFKALALPPWMLDRARERLKDPSAIDQLVKQLVTVTALHEMAHACGVPGHLNDVGEESSEGDDECVMRYLDRADNQRLVTLQVLLGLTSPMGSRYKKLCNVGFSCFSKINVKD